MYLSLYSLYWYKYNNDVLVCVFGILVKRYLKSWWRLVNFWNSEKQKRLPGKLSKSDYTNFDTKATLYYTKYVWFYLVSIYITAFTLFVIYSVSIYITAFTLFVILFSLH